MLIYVNLVSSEYYILKRVFKYVLQAAYTILQQMSVINVQITV